MKFAKYLTAFSVFSVVAGATLPANAITTFFGEDLNTNSNPEQTPLSNFPNADAAENNFKSNLVDTGTEDFESFSEGEGEPLSLDFPRPGGTLNATLSGGSGEIESVTSGTTNGFGRYGTSGSNFWEVEARSGTTNNFNISFNEPVAAFSFHGVDVGDFGGQLELELSNGTTQTIDISNTIDSPGGSVLYQGAIVDRGKEIESASILTQNTGEEDLFAFDDFTVGTREQVQSSEPVPFEAEGTMGLVALGGFIWYRRRKKRNQALSQESN